MEQFFTSWRRKLGVGTLLAMCVLMGGCIRSYSSCDTIEIPIRVDGVTFFTFIDSKNGVIQYVNDHRNVLPIKFLSNDVEEPG